MVVEQVVVVLGTMLMVYLEQPILAVVVVVAGMELRVHIQAVTVAQAL